MAIRRDKTALHRVTLSRPLQLALDAGLATAGRTSIFDYGCGRGADVHFLRAHGFDSSGWDPAHFPKEELRAAEVVNLGFVINVIEDPAERVDVVRSAYSLAREVLIVAARLRSDVDDLPGDEFGDGRLTRIGSFQCFYEQSELAGWLEAVLDVRPVAASPGVFFIFRDAARREAFVAERFRRRLAGPRPSISAELYQANRELLESLGSFFQDRGRLPVVGEWVDEADAKGVFGSIARAWAVVKRVTDADAWARIAIQRSEDLLVYMVQAQFGKAPRFSELPAAIQADVRAFFGTYIRAQQEAMLLLRQLGDQELVNMACKASPVGKVTPQALYVHESAIDKLPTVLRCYHACAEGLTGQVEAANLIKLHRFKPQVSFLAYPDFDVEAHPALRRSVTAKLDVARVSLREYAADGNPPILHRKEEFVAVEHPLRKKFERLTKQEEKAGLFGDPSAIGTASGWAQALEKAGVVIRGHQVRRR